jgi:hypothetical protein
MNQDLPGIYTIIPHACIKIYAPFLCYLSTCLYCYGFIGQACQFVQIFFLQNLVVPDFFPKLALVEIMPVYDRSVI